MFKLIQYINASGETLNPLSCAILRSYVRDQVVVVTQCMLEMLGGMQLLREHGVLIEQLIVMGDEAELLKSGIKEPAVYVRSLAACVAYISKFHRGCLIWLIADNATANDLIWRGVVLDVHLAKNYAKEEHRLEQFIPLEQSEQSGLLEQSVPFDISLLVCRDMEFEVMSHARDPNSATKAIRHFWRRNTEEHTLLTTLREVIDRGFKRPSRTGIDTRALFGKQFEYFMKERVDPKTGLSYFRLPLLTTKCMFTRGVFAELKWFLSGNTNSRDLEAQGVNIWRGNSSRAFLDARGLDYPEGACGPIYGYQWRNWPRNGTTHYDPSVCGVDGGGFDQVQAVIDSLQADPFGRRHIISAWNVGDLDAMSLAPCHVSYQFLVHEEHGQKYLSLFMYQRSCDSFLGLPFNLASMGFFLLLIAHRVGYKPYKLIHSIADMHVYENHIEQTELQVQREPFMFPYARVSCGVKEHVEDYDFTDITIEEYNSYPRIKADMAV